MSRHCMLCMSKVFEGKFLRENLEKWCNLVSFGVYFDQMFLKIIPKITIFSSFFFFSKKLPIVVVRDVCPSVRPSVRRLWK